MTPQQRWEEIVAAINPDAAARYTNEAFVYRGEPEELAAALKQLPTDVSGTPVYLEIVLCTGYTRIVRRSDVVTFSDLEDCCFTEGSNHYAYEE